MTRTLRRNWNRFLGTLLPFRHESEMAQELASHIELMTDDLIARGVAPDEARRRARLRFGSVDATAESCRDQRRLPAIEMVLQDLRFSWRGIRRSPGFAIVAVLSLAIGIGANTAIFSIVNAVLLRPLGFREPERLFAAREFVPPLTGLNAVNPTHPLEWAVQCPSLEGVALMRGGRAQLTGDGEPMSVPSIRVSPNLLSLVGVEPMLGRSFLGEEDTAGREAVAIVSERLWRSRFNADPALVGRTITIDGRPHQVVGIVPAWFRPPYTVANARFDVLLPLVLDRAERARLTGNFNYAAVVRVRSGISSERALAEINAVEAQIVRRAGANRQFRAALIPVHELATSRARLGLWTLSAAVGAVLLIVCVNLANLLLSRITSRSRETAIRSALGASRGRQFSQVLTESVALSVIGGWLGVLLAQWVLRLLLSSTTLDIPRLDEAGLDATVLLFAFGLALVTGLVFGILPAWRFTRSNPQDALRSGGRGMTDARGSLRLREGLISLEVGMSAALLILAALMSASLFRLLQVDKGFESHRVVAVDVRLAGGAYDDEAVQQQFYDRVLARIGALPAVEAVGFTTVLPTRGESWNDPIYLEGGERHAVNNRYASPGYFRALNIAIRKGRAFDDSDRDRSVAVLSEKAAQILWPGDNDPIGRRFMGEDDKVKTLVGIVADVRASLQYEAPATAYYPYWQRVPDGGTLVVRTAAQPAAIAGALRQVLRTENPQLPIAAIQTMDEVVDESVAQRRFQATLMAVFAASALLVASLGIYGVVSYSVARRRSEIGIRLALGASRSRLLALVVRQGMTPVVVGLALGIAAALIVSGAIRGLLFGIAPNDPLTIAGVAVVLLLVGALACVIPARRAAGIDAISALRFE